MDQPSQVIEKSYGKNDTSDKSANSDVESSESAHSSRGRSSVVSDGEDDTANTLKTKLAQKETLKVNRSRYIVILILAVTAIAISVVVYKISQRAQNEQFQSQYDGAAAKIMDSFQSIPTKFGILNTISIGATILNNVARNANTSSWPFIAIPAYEHRASLVLELATSLSISIHPYITEQNREKWEQYSVGPDNAWM